MQALMLRALHRTPKLFKGAPISFSQHSSPYRHNHISSSAEQQPQREMENQVLFTGKEDTRQGYREDMVESYGVAYATRCSDEGYGERYGEGVRESLDKEDMKMSFGLSHATSSFGEGYKESHGESITLGNHHVGGDEMTNSFGLAYATRCFDEGYGDRYEESIEVEGKHREGIKVLGNENLEEKEHVSSEDVINSFGLAYATRCFDEGYGDRYGESLEAMVNCGEDIKVLGNQNLEEKDLAKSFELAFSRGCFDQKVDEEDMTQSFGLAYATRCSDEGYGERYGESINVLHHQKHIREMEM